MKKRIYAAVLSLLLMGCPVSAAEKEEPLPIGEDERLAVLTGKKSFVILDRNGKITNRFEHAELCDSAFMGTLQGAIVLPEDRPLPIKMKTGTGTEQYLAGLYSLKEDRWMIEPAYSEMHLLGDNLCTDSDMMLSGGRLMSLDGTVLHSTNQYFAKKGTYICDESHIYDLEGNLLSEYDGFINDVIDDELLLITRSDGTTVLQDASGNPVWQEESGLYYAGKCGEYLNWTDENGAGMITDLQKNRVADDAALYRENPESGLAGSGMRLISQSPDGERKLIGLWNEAASYYYLCDAAYHITAAYPGEQISLEMSGDEVIPWYWYQDQEGILHVEEIWTDFSLEVSLAETAVNWVTVYRKGSVAVVQYVDEAWKYHGIVFVNGEVSGQAFTGGCSLEEIGDQVLLAGGYDYETDTYSSRYYLEDGTCLSGDDTVCTLYANKDFRCVQYGSYIYVEDSDGNLYARLLCGDEEREEPEMKMP